MRILLDENLPRKLKDHLPGDVKTVPECGWAGVKNGRLLALANAHFDVFVTMDKGFPFQQNLSGLHLCTLVLSAPSNDIDDLLPLVPPLRAALSVAHQQKGAVLRISHEATKG